MLIIFVPYIFNHNIIYRGFMDNHLHILYRHTLAKYKKYRSRFRKSLKSGLYYEYSEKKQRQIVQRIDKLKQRLSSLQWQLKLALASGTLAMSLSLSGVNAQQLGPFVPNEPKNPLPSVQISTFGSEHPAVVDIDNDGDLDVFIGTSFGTIAFLRNDGTASKPLFIQQYSTDNPANGIDVGYAATPSFADLDKDGDFDLIIGQSYQYPFSPFNNVRYYENTGTDTKPAFTLPTGEHPMDNVFSDSYHSHPAFTDIDDDGDLDVFVGGSRNTNYSSYRETIKFWRNDGSLPVAQFAAETGSSNPVSIVNPEFGGTLDLAAPAMVDIDDDGDEDMFVGDASGNILFFRNTGNNTTPDFPSEITGANNPFDGINLGSNASPEFADLDGDGDFDAIAGSGPYTRLRYFENIGSASAPNFVERFDIANPFVGLQIGYNASPAFADLDFDTDIDVIVGGKYSNDTLKYFQNNNGKFSQVSGAASPIKESFENFLFKFSPALADLDNDGDADLLLGLENRYTYPGETFLHYYKNNDNNALELQPPLIADTTQNQSFSPTFGDVDLDGDYDLVLGSREEGRLRYFENTGDLSAPAFTERTGTDNPFDGIFLITTPYTNFARPELVDLDHDGDYDLVIGVGDNDYSGDLIPEDGTLRFFINTNGAFSEALGASNPFDGFDVGKDADPAFADIDEDGDLDAHVGNHYGEVRFFENQNQPPQITSGVASQSYTEGEPPVVLAPSLVISDDTNDNITGARIAITNNYLSGTDSLAFTPQGAITGTFDVSSGVLSLSGYATIADYQAALRTVTFVNTGVEPGSEIRTIEISATDFDNTTPTPVTIEVNVTPVEDPIPSELTIYNAVSPNNDGLNDWWEIFKISSPNKIELYNRWGDLVKTLNNYVSEENNLLDDLPSATYYYKIESPQGEYTGYLVIKK